MDITRWSIPKSDWLFSLQPKMDKLYIVSKNRTRNWLWLRSWTAYCQIQFIHSVMYDSLQPHGLQHARPPCPSPSPGVYWDPMFIESAMPSNHLILCHPLLLPPSSFPASGSFLMSQFFTSGGQSIGVSDSASVLQMNIQDWCPLGWTGLISLQSNDSRVFSNTNLQKHQFFGSQLSL